MRSYGLKHHYGISREIYNLMLAAQNGVCAVCKQTRNRARVLGVVSGASSVDHNHETNNIRGLLCIAMQLYGSVNAERAIGISCLPASNISQACRVRCASRRQT